MEAAAVAYLLIALIAGAAVGAVIAWLYASREGAGAKQTVETLRMQLDAVVRERDEARSSHEASSRELAALQADARNFEQRMKDLAESRDTLVTQFREIGDQLLEKAHKDFLEKAGARLSEADKASQAKLQTLLQPVELTLKQYQAKLDEIEKDRTHSYGELRGLMGELRKDQGQVRDETRNLVNALRSSPKARGRWGEQSLRNVLEQAGLSPYADFQTEVTVDGEDGKLRPDVIVNLPGGRTLVIDAKCSLNAYLDACDEVDDDKRHACLQAHLASIRNHAQQLGSKAYWAQFGDSADYVVMYIPGEHFLTAALELDHGLWDWANERRVLLATPTNLVAIARTVASIWNQEKLAAEAGKIAELGRELHSRLATMAEHVASVGTNLSRANNAYNKMVGSFESQVFTQARRFEDYGAGSSKDIPPLPMVEASPRPLTKLAAKDEDAVVISLDDPHSPRLEKAEEEAGGQA